MKQLHQLWQQLRRKKTATQLQDQANRSYLQRSLGLMELCALGIAAVVGTGVFVLTGHVAANNTGPAVVIAYLIAALAAAFSGLCYAEMAAMIPLSGSAYSYAYAAMGELFAFLMGWVLVLEFGVAACTVSIAWSGYAQALLGIKFASSGINWGAGLVLLVVTIVLTCGTQASMQLMKAIVAIKLGVIVLFVGTCSRYIQVKNWQPFLPASQGTFGHFGWSGVLQGACMLFFAYGGFDTIATAAQEAKRPQRDIPLAMIISIAVAALLYCLVALVLTGVVPYQQLQTAQPMAKGIEVTGMPFLVTLIDGGALIGLTAVLMVQLYSLSRIVLTMHEDGLLFASWLHLSRHLTILIGMITALAAALLPLALCSALTSVAILASLTMVSFAVVLLRWQEPTLVRPFRIPGPFWGVPLLATMIALGLLSTAPTSALLHFTGIVLVGLGYYLSYGRHSSRCKSTPLF